MSFLSNLLSRISQSGEASLDAVRSGNIRKVSSMLSKGADANQCDEDGYSALHYGSVSDVNMIDLLVKNGAKVNYTNSDGSTPLHVASINGNFDGVVYLVKNGADHKIKNKKGKTPLDEASHGVTAYDMMESDLGFSSQGSRSEKSGRNKIIEYLSSL